MKLGYIYIYIYIDVCVCVYNYIDRDREEPDIVLIVPQSEVCPMLMCVVAIIEGEHSIAFCFSPPSPFISILSFSNSSCMFHPFPQCFPLQMHSYIF